MRGTMLWCVSATVLCGAAVSGCDDAANGSDARADVPGDQDGVDSADSADSGPGDTSPDGADATPPSDVPLPALVSIEPHNNAANVPRTAWVRIVFASTPGADALAGIRLDCGAGTPAFTVEAVDAIGAVVVNPVGELPAGARCAVTWHGPALIESRGFSVAAAGDEPAVPYDRADATRLAPFPDDALLVADQTTATGMRVQVPTLDRPADVQTLLAALTAVLPVALDGWSPLAPFVVELPAGLDATSLPLSEAASLDPLATIGLFDLDARDDHGDVAPARRAFDAVLKDEPNADGSAAHVLMLFPIAPLAPRGHYALVVTRRAFVDATRPLSAAAAMARALADATTPSGAAAALLTHSHPALHADDIALVLRVSIRSMDHAGDDLVAIRAAVQGAPPPTYQITKVTPEPPPSAVAAIVQGTWDAPDWRDGDFVRRDGDGHPKAVGTHSVPFVVALPASADDSPAPIVMYQHGNPGSAEAEVPQAARESLAAAGFAVAGFTDSISRELGGDSVSQYTTAVVEDILGQHRVPDFVAVLDTADQLSFLRLLKNMSALDVLPLEHAGGGAGHGDGAPDVDVAAPLGYLGISYGSFRGVGLVPFAPEIRAAALVVGGGRFTCTIVKQEADGPEPNHVYSVVTSLFKHVTRVELWVGIALAQMAIDDQDWLTHASHVYVDRYPLERPERASVLMVEGLGDSLVPTYSTRAAATAMGLTQLLPAPDPAPTLTPVVLAAGASLAGNIDADTTGGFLQYVPAGLAGYVTSDACGRESEGHYCAQIAARPVFARFFRSALDGVPTITP